ncbi:endo-1,4-beta-xylanase [Sabulicella glaciei]|uniref:Beta-xylanase n=1 Tax=Sabulicella glaciei TaxID=2984948 RepID=A0ABT3P1U8_9PROT|nr:endo-1,4-beta-xylanase [Roseococcus sp. MDT2-1-1]
MTGRRAALGLGLAAGAASGAAAQGRPTLREAARGRGLVFGTAVQSQMLATDAGLRALAQREAELWVPAWEAKWGPVQPEEGRFEFAPLRALLQLAQPSGQRLRGHCLVWHEANPPWLAPALAEGPARARRVLEEHFRVVLGTTAPAMRDWDVVNEFIANPPGSDNPSASPGDLRDTPWLRALGPGYVELALRTARQLDRTLRLTLNDYGVEADTPPAAEKRARLLRQVRGLLDRGAPLDAIGIQAHLQMREPFRPEPFITFCQELRSMGLAVLVTELDIREPDVLAPNVPTRDQAVADYIGRFVSAALEGGVRTILTWGLADRESWLVSTPSVARADGATTRGLPFDDALRPKPFRDALLDAFARV